MSIFNTSASYLKGNQKSQVVVLLVILSVMSIFMILSFHPWGKFYWGDDVHFHMQRMESIMDALRNETFPIYLDYKSLEGFGYPTKWFYPDILLVPFALIGICTDILFAYKSLFFVLTILCGLFTYCTVNRIYNNSFVAATAAIVYTFSMYRIQNLFERMAVGESIAFTIIPIVFLGLYEVMNGNYKKWYILSIGYSLLMMSHVISCVIMGVMTIIMLLIHYKSFLAEKVRLWYLILSGLVAIGLSAYFLFPLLEQMMSNTFYYSVHKPFTIWGKALSIPVWIWSLGFSFTTPNMDLLFKPSMGLVSVLLIYLRFFVWKSKIKTDKLAYSDKYVVLGIILVVSALSVFPWKVFPFSLLNVIQFPWRLYGFATFVFAIGGAYYLSLVVKTFNRRTLVLSAIIIASAWVIVYESATLHTKRHDGIMTTSDLVLDKKLENNFGLGFLEYVSAKVPNREFLYKRKGKIISGKSKTIVDGYTTTDDGITRLHVEASQPDRIELPLLYYKGYRASLNGKTIPLRESSNGMVEIDIEDSGDISIEYAGTLIQKVSPLISIVCLLVLIFYIYKIRRKGVIE